MLYRSIFLKMHKKTIINRQKMTSIFAATLLLHNQLSATHPPLLSAKTFFIAALQCYFEKKTIKPPYFSIPLIVNQKLTFVSVLLLIFQVRYFNIKIFHKQSVKSLKSIESYNCFNSFNAFDNFVKLKKNI